VFAVLDDGRTGLGHSEAFTRRFWPYQGGAMLNFAQTEFSELAPALVIPSYLGSLYNVRWD
jgi:hypothetical protein